MSRDSRGMFDQDGIENTGHLNPLGGIDGGIRYAHIEQSVRVYCGKYGFLII